MKMNESIQIEGEKVFLRPITPADTPLIVRWRSDPQVYGTLSGRSRSRKNGIVNGCGRW